MLKFPIGEKKKDLEILAYLPDQELFNYCTVNKYARNLCNKDSFWRKRLFNTFQSSRLNEETFQPRYRWKYVYLSVIKYLYDADNDKRLAFEMALENRDKDAAKFLELLGF
jgi:hypothetical protein